MRVCGKPTNNYQTKNSRKSTVYPKKARNVDGAFVFIVNDEDYKQVLIEIASMILPLLIVMMIIMIIMITLITTIMMMMFRQWTLNSAWVRGRAAETRTMHLLTEKLCAGHFYSPTSSWNIALAVSVQCLL